ncbi:ribonuclease E/G [Hyphomonas sp. FCG-A18]|uniref:Rne/Rng family ribonuclease n=1 Tax=Hyphomonas sp. FCG-A18 TaxID=3080019 RepID=UPI002B2B3FB6|nr:ribonuclease E/G [Hyphomonas sp. FCG-A18]
MKKQMLIDAVHPEETRVALVNDGRIEDFDFETTGNEQLRGNIYLAKVTRVEPSLQACFVEYGGNRHGFLAFSEIHPDYYQLPQEDREALLEEAAREAEEAADEDPDDEDDLDEEESDASAEDDTDDDTEDSDASDEVSEASELDVIDADDDGEGDTAEATDDEKSSDASTGEDETEEASEDSGEKKPARAARRKRPARKTRGSSLTKRYKIQEVIRRRQILLVQVVKEERGNKGAALTTYLSLAGRYSVLMPNTPRGGGISRKIPNGADRKRLKTIMDGLEVPKGMGLIVRTAGAKRTKSEIRRDYDYLQNLWAKIRSTTMDSVAPALIHEEGGLVHRAMRDMFDREIEEVIVQGDTAYREAKDLAKTLMPTQARKVKRWTSPAPLFVSEGVEGELDSVFSPVVQMKSGGYLVINQTEALVAIDVNSGKSTKERSIEHTALRTNLEAAEEACRQMRLRDLAGLVVIDFIDMDENKNNRAVEKKMKECLKLDRARVQNNRISQFGLMEISRQRRRAGVLQSTSEKCDVCDGTGRRRSIPSAALQLLRAIEARAAGYGLRGLTVTAPTDVALYLLNSKRDQISAIEEEAGFTIAIKSDGEMIPGDFQLDADKDPKARRRRRKTNRAEFLVGDEDDHLLPTEEDDAEEDAELLPASDEDDQETRSDSEGEEGGKRKRRRRGRRGGRRRRRDGIEVGPPPADGGALLDGLSLSLDTMLGDEPPALPEAAEGGLKASAVALPMATKPVSEPEKPEASETVSEDGEGGTSRKRRRRRRKRPNRDEVRTEEAQAEASAEETSVEAESPIDESAEGLEVVNAGSDETATPDPEPKAETPAPAEAEEAPIVAIEPEETPEPAAVEVETKPALEPTVEEQPVTTEPVLETAAPKKKKRGWWSRG